MTQKATVTEQSIAQARQARTKDDKENKPYPFPIDRLTTSQEIIEATPEVEQVKEKPYPFPVDR